MILGNPTPELTRLRAALRIEWAPYRAWVDANLDRVNQLADQTEASGEDETPALHAQYIFERWISPAIPTVYGATSLSWTARVVAKAKANVAWMRTALIGTLALSAIGCTTLRTPTEVHDAFPSAALEGVYQVASGYDYATTVNIARRPDCYRETGFPTRQLLGDHPSESNVEAYWAAGAVAHLAMSYWLDREVDATDSNGWRAARIAWHVLTIGVSVRQDIRNANIGLRPFGAGADPRCQGSLR